jgi:spermidine synthase
LGSKKYDPLTVDESQIEDLDTKYYSPRLHKAAFVLPKFVEKLIQG